MWSLGRQPEGYPGGLRRQPRSWWASPSPPRTSWGSQVPRRHVSPSPGRRPHPAAPRPPPLGRAESPSDEVFLSELELALERPHTRELVAFDDAHAARPRSEREVTRARVEGVSVGSGVASLIFRKGLDMQHAVAAMLAENYHSALIDAIKADDFTYKSRPAHHPPGEGIRFLLRRRSRGGLRLPDAQTLSRSPRVPDRRDHPQPARQRTAAGHGHPVSQRGTRRQALGPSDVVILPAFGVTVATLQQLERRGCTLIDTTCGSVLNVWKNVRRYAEGGYTSVIHGKVWHEETQATASQAVTYGGKYLVVFDRREAEIVCDYIVHGGDRNAFVAHFGKRGIARLQPGHRPAADWPRQPDDDADVRVARCRRDDPGGHGGPVRSGGRQPELSGVRHHLQRHAGSPGCRRRRCCGRRPST